MIETIFRQTEVAVSVQRAIAGVILALGAAAAAWRAGSLSRSGFMAATVSGTLCVSAGWNWALVLALYFVAAMTLSFAGKEAKEALTRGVVAKGGARDASQVIANGGVYSIAAVVAATLGASWLAWGAIGALAAASADTWATEVGVGLGGTPRSILSRTYVRSGESGGVTAAGLIGSASGAAWVGLTAMTVGFPRTLGVAALIVGFLGSIIDSLLGAAIQERLWCDVCKEATERPIHLCGSPARRAGGIAGLNNDVVNLLSTCAGLVLGVMAYWIAGSWGAIG